MPNINHCTRLRQVVPLNSRDVLPMGSILHTFLMQVRFSPGTAGDLKVYVMLPETNSYCGEP